MQQNHRDPVSEFAIASLTAAILSFFPFGLANLGCAILAIVLGVLALKRVAASGSNVRGQGLATIGIVLGAICLLIIIIGAITLARHPELLDKAIKAPAAQ